MTNLKLTLPKTENAVIKLIHKYHQAKKKELTRISWRKEDVRLVTLQLMLWVSLKRISRRIYNKIRLNVLIIASFSKNKKSRDSREFPRIFNFCPVVPRNEKGSRNASSRFNSQNYKKVSQRISFHLVHPIIPKGKFRKENFSWCLALSSSFKT